MQLDELVRMHARKARAYFKKHPEAAIYASKGTDHRVRVVRDGPQIVVCITPADASDYADPLVQETLYLCAPCQDVGDALKRYVESRPNALTTPTQPGADRRRRVGKVKKALNNLERVWRAHLDLCGDKMRMAQIQQTRQDGRELLDKPWNRVAVEKGRIRPSLP